MEIVTHHSHVQTEEYFQITRVVCKVLGLTLKKRIYNYKIIFILQHNLP